jgi:hypothetical protein
MPPAPSRLDSLRRALAGLATRRKPMEEPQRRAMAIFLSLVIAFLLWLTFSLRETYTITVQMPIEIGRLPDGRALGEYPPREARVTLQGIGHELIGLQRNPPVLVLNASGETVDVLAAATEGVRLPSGLTVQSVSPSTISLSLEPEVSRRVPIQLVLDLDPAQDHDFLGTPQLDPDSVTVSGARSLVHLLGAFPTRPLRADGVRESFTARVALSDTLRGLVRTNIASTEASVQVARFTEGSRDVDVRVQGGPADALPVVLLPSRVRATFRVPIDQYDRALRTPDFFAFVPYSSVLADTTGSLMPVVQPPEGLAVRDIRLEPRRVRYWVRIE